MLIYFHRSENVTMQSYYSQNCSFAYLSKLYFFNKQILYCIKKDFRSDNIGVKTKIISKIQSLKRTTVTKETRKKHKCYYILITFCDIWRKNRGVIFHNIQKKKDVWKLTKTIYVVGICKLRCASKQAKKDVNTEAVQTSFFLMFLISCEKNPYVKVNLVLSRVILLQHNYYFLHSCNFCKNVIKKGSR